MANTKNVLFTIRDTPVVMITQSRVRLEERNPELHYYDIRHDDEQWDPCSIEKGVWVNHFGTMATLQPFAILDEPKGEINLTNEESEQLYNHI